MAVSSETYRAIIGKMSPRLRCRRGSSFSSTLSVKGPVVWLNFDQRVQKSPTWGAAVGDLETFLVQKEKSAHCTCTRSLYLLALISNCYVGTRLALITQLRSDDEAKEASVVSNGSSLLEEGSIPFSFFSFFLIFCNLFCRPFCYLLEIIRSRFYGC